MTRMQPFQMAPSTPLMTTRLIQVKQQTSEHQVEDETVRRTNYHLLRSITLHQLLMLTLCLICIMATPIRSMETMKRMPSPSMSIHHLALYTTPSQPPTTLAFLLFTLPQSAPIIFQVPKLTLNQDGVIPRVKVRSEWDGVIGGGEDDSVFELRGLHEVHVEQIGTDVAELKCGGEAGDVSMSLLPYGLSHQLPENATHTDIHASSFDHWLIANDPKRVMTVNGKKVTRKHTSLTFILPQMQGHRETELARYIRTIPKVRKLLREYPNTMLVATPVESHLPYYDQVTLLNSTNFIADVVNGVEAPWTCDFRFKDRREQTVWPVTRVYQKVRGRLNPVATTPIVFPSIKSTTIPQHGVLIVTPSDSTANIVARDLKPTTAELASMENARRQAEQNREDQAMVEAQESEGVISLLDVDAVMGIQSGAVKAVLAPVFKILYDAIADEGEHTADQEAGSRIEFTTPSQVLELVMQPLKDGLQAGIAPGVSASIMASLTASMTEYLSTYIHDEVTHDATPPLYLAVTEILEKHVKDAILKAVPPAIRKSVPITLTNRLGRSLIHSVPPALTQILKIAHSPTLHYFCFKCFYGSDLKKYTLFKPLEPGMPKSGYEQKNYCELCHSSPERIYYHNYHSAYYADYYSNYYVPYYTGSLVGVEGMNGG